MPSVDGHERAAPDAVKRPVWRRILAYAIPYWPFVVLGLVLTLVMSSADFARAYLIKPLVDEVALPYASTLPRATDLLPGAEQTGPAPGSEADLAARAEAAERLRERFTELLLLLAVAMIVLPIAGFAREYVTAWSLGRMNVDMKRDACSKLLALPLGFHHGRRRGDVYARVVGDAGVAHSALQLLFGDVFDALIRIAVGVGFLLMVSWKLTLVTLLMGPVVFGVVAYFGKRIRSSARKRQVQSAEVTQRLFEILAGIKVIKAFRAEAVEDAAYRRETRKLFKRSMRVTKNRLFARSLVELMNQLMTLAAIVAGIALMDLWKISFGDLAAFTVLTMLSYRPVKRLARAWTRVMDSAAGADRFLEVMDAPVLLRDAPDAIDLPPIRRGVSLRDVCFAYAEEPVLREVSFEARAGEVVAIVGRTGAGKTTLTDLLLRLYDPTSGSIEIDGTDLRRIRRDSLLARTAVVTQEPFLFDGTIRDNLRYGRPDATDDEVLAAARAAHIDEFVSQLPRGYETEVGPTGVRLSGGQRQRVTVGRAILKDPDILILDEATSSLDSKSEKAVQEAIDTLLGGGRTVFAIAHRLATIRRADRIVVLEAGRITQQGTHDELMVRGGLYRDLVELQTLDPGASV